MSFLAKKSPGIGRSTLLITIAGSFILSYLALLHYDVINRDGILYLQTARITISDGSNTAFKMLGWPFYSFLIAFTHKITNISYLHAAMGLNFLFDLGTALVFLKLLSILGFNSRVLFAGMITILLFHKFDSLRIDILRDHGYWFFILLSLYWFIKFSEHSKILYATAWSSASILATLFRHEGILFQALAPAACLFICNWPWKQRFIAILKLNILTIIAAISFLIYGVTYNQYIFNKMLPFVTAFFDCLKSIDTYIFTGIHEHWLSYSHTILQQSASPSTFIAFSLSIAVIYLLANISVFSWGYTFILLFGIKKSLNTIDRKHRTLLVTYFLIPFLTTLYFYLHFLSLTQINLRYFIPYLLIILLFVPVGIVKIYDNWKQTNQKLSLQGLAFPLLIIIILIHLGGSLFQFGPSKAYVKRAGDWIAQQKPRGKPITNDVQLNFYANQNSDRSWLSQSVYDDYKKILHEKTKVDRLYAIVIYHSDLKRMLPMFKKKFKSTPIKTFRNGRGDSVVIFIKK
jgi:hypothetical protein